MMDRTARLGVSKVSHRRGALTLAAVIALGLSACGTSTDAAGGSGKAEPVTIRLSDSFPPKHTTTVEGAEFFMKRATELSGGSIKFEHFPAEQLAAAPDLLDAANTGVTEMAYVGMAYVGDAMPLSDVGSLPGSFTTAAHGTRAYWKVVQDELLEEEYLPNGVRPLWAAMNPPYNIATTKAQVKTIEDVRGLNLRASGGTLSRTIKAIGGNPVQIAAPEIYQALQRGTIDGNVGPISSLPDYELQEVLKYGTTNVSLGSFVQAYVINERFWKELSPEQQDALVQAGEETMEHLPGLLDKEVNQVVQDFNAQGLEFSELEPGVAKAFNTEALAIWEEWAAEFDARGLNGTQTIEAWKKALKETE